MRIAHCCAACLVLLVAMTMGAQPCEAGAGREWLRVDDRLLADAVARGAARSRTFERLLDRLEASDVIVYVLRAPAHGAHERGRTQFIVRAGGFRFLRVVIHADAMTRGLVALIGHELRHVAELADAPWVVDTTSYHELYRTIGYNSCDELCPCFDTQAAVEAGREVYRELRSRRPRVTAVAAEE